MASGSENIPLSIQLSLEERAFNARVKAAADRTQNAFSKIRIGGFDGGAFKVGSAALGQISRDADQFEKSMKAANARVLAFGTAVGVIEGMRRSFLALIKTTVDVETALAKINIVAENDLKKAGSTIEQVGDTIFKVAKETGQSWQTAADAMLDFSRQGVKPVEALKRTRDALVLSRISGLDYKEAVSGLTSILNAFNKTGIDSSTVINKLVAVDNNAAASAADLTQGLQRMASTAQLTGQSIDDAVASIATLQEITFRGGPQIGNSLKSLAIRIFDPENIKYIESLGDGMTKVRDDSQNLLPAIKIIGNLGDTLEKLPQEERIDAIKNIFGQYQTNAAAALIQGMKQVNEEFSLFEKNRRTSEGAGNNAFEANAKLSELLSSKLNVLDVQIADILNSFGRLGVANPLSSLLDTISGYADEVKGAITSTNSLAVVFQTIAKAIGGAVVSKAGFFAILFVIGKIAKDFVSFGLEAGRTFLGLNKSSQEQAAIQRSIAAYIQQSGQNLNVLLGSEQARLSLTKQIAASWNQAVLSAQQMAAVTKQIAVPIFNSGLRAGPTGPTRRAAEGFLPLVDAEMNDVKRGVGGAATNSKVVVMPNFPFGGGKRGMMVANSSETVIDYGGGKYGISNPDMLSGRAASGFLKGQKPQTSAGTFAPVNLIEGAVEGLIQLLFEWGKTIDEISSAARHHIKSFDLSAKSLEKLSFLADERIKQLDSIAKVPRNPLSVGRSRTSLPGRDLSGNPTFAHLNEPIRNPFSPQSADPFTRAQEIGRIRELDRIKNQPRGLTNIAPIVERQKRSERYRAENEEKHILEQERRIRLQSVYGEALAARRVNKGSSYGGGFKSGLANIESRLNGADASKETKSKPLDPEAFNKFATKAFIGIAALEGITSTARGTSAGLDNLLDVVNKSAVAFAGIAAIQQFGGFNVTDLFGKIFGGASKAGGGILSKISGFLAPLARLTPVIGQVGIALFAANSIIEDFTGKSGLQRLKEAFGGLTEEAEKSAQAFKENAQVLFDASGKAILKTPEEVSQGFRSRLEIAQRERFAQSKGINTKDKSQQDIQNELLGKKIDELLGATKTGSLKRVEFGSYKEGTKEKFDIPETLGNIDGSITAVIKENLQLLSNQTENGLREFLSSKGISRVDTIGENGPSAGKDIKDAKQGELQDIVYKLFLETIKNELGTIKLTKETGGTKDFINLLTARFFDLPSKSPQGIDAKTGKPIPTTPIKVAQEQVQNLLDVKSLREEILTNEELSLKTQLRTGELTDLENAKLEASLRLIENQRQERQKIIDLVKDSSSTFGKADLKDGVETSKLDELKSKIDTFSGGAEQAKSIVEEIGQLFVPKKAKELTAIFESGNKRLEEQKKIREEILKQTNAQSIKEAEILQNLERQRSLVQSKFDLGESERSLARGRNENRASELEARASGANVGILESESLRRQALLKKQKNISSLIKSEEENKQKAVNDLFSKSNTLSLEDYDNQLKTIDNTTQERIDALKAESAALDENIKTLGEVPGFLKEFGDQLVNFQRSLPQSAAQNKFNLLQSTDAQSRIGGLISDQVFSQSGGKTGEELVSFVSDQNALLLEQSKIRTAANASERLELETQYKLTQQIIEIKKLGLSPLEEQLRIEQAINQNIKERQTFGFGVKQANADIQSRIQGFPSDFGKTAVEGFKDSLSDAIKAAVSQTDNLKTALLDVALAFANRLRDKAIDNLADIVTNSLFKNEKSGGGGVVSGIVGALGGLFGGAKKYASGGLITGGSGNKDDVPTLLMGGEYVVPKDTVSEYGKGFFDRLRNGSVGKMAQGGFFAPGIRGQGTISGKENLLDFATQTATSGKNDLISSLSANAGLVSLEPESLRLSNFARFGDSPIGSATQEAKDQAFQLYLGQLEDEKAYQEQLEQLKKAEKAKKKQLLTSLAIAAIGAGVSYGVGKIGTPKALNPNLPAAYNAKTGLYQTVGSGQTSNGGSFFGSLFKGLGGVFSPKSTANVQSQRGLGIESRDGYYNPYPSSRSGPTSADLSFPEAPVYIPNHINMFNGLNYNPKSIKNFQNAGGYTNGNGDTQPAMLSKGEFVLNKQAVDKIGDKNLYAMNSGANPSGEKDSEARIVSKLDELIQKTIGASNVTVNVEMSGGEEKKSSQTSDGEDQSPRLLVQRIKEVVIGVIREEQRPGGTLRR